MFEKVSVPILGVVENMSYLEDEDSQKEVLPFRTRRVRRPPGSRKPVFRRNPLHEEVRMGGDHGTPIVVTNPENSASQAIQRIAKSLVGILGL